MALISKSLSSISKIFVQNFTMRQCTLMMVWSQPGELDGWGLGPQGIETSVGPIDRCHTSSQQACAQTIKTSPTSKLDADITAVDMVVECIYQLFCPKSDPVLTATPFGERKKKCGRAQDGRNGVWGEQLVLANNRSSHFEMLQRRLWWEVFSLQGRVLQTGISNLVTFSRV